MVQSISTEHYVGHSNHLLWMLEIRSSAGTYIFFMGLYIGLMQAAVLLYCGFVLFGAVIGPQLYHHMPLISYVKYVRFHTNQTKKKLYTL